MHTHSSYLVVFLAVTPILGRPSLRSSLSLVICLLPCLHGRLLSVLSLRSWHHRRLFPVPTAILHRFILASLAYYSHVRSPTVCWGGRSMGVLESDSFGRWWLLLPLWSAVAADLSVSVSDRLSLLIGTLNCLFGCLLFRHFLLPSVCAFGSYRRPRSCFRLLLPADYHCRDLFAGHSCNGVSLWLWLPVVVFVGTDCHCRFCCCCFPRLLLSVLLWAVVAACCCCSWWGILPRLGFLSLLSTPAVLVGVIIRAITNIVLFFELGHGVFSVCQKLSLLLFKRAALA
jgi:hypothetical protein